MPKSVIIILISIHAFTSLSYAQSPMSYSLSFSSEQIIFTSIVENGRPGPKNPYT